MVYTVPLGVCLFRRVAAAQWVRCWGSNPRSHLMMRWYKNMQRHTRRRCLTYGRDTVNYCCLRFFNFCRPPWLISSGVLCNVCSVAYLVLSGNFKGSCVYLHPVKNDSHAIFDQILCNLQNTFVKKVIWIWNSNGKNRSIINKVRTFELVVSLIVHQMSYSLGSPNATKRN